MLQGLRDNMKGTVVATVITLFFILPMVISGVGSSWLGSVAGTDAAKVDGKSISKNELRSQVYREKARLESQKGVDPSADYLKEENLRQPVLDRLTKKSAVLASAERGGMGVSDNVVNSVIVAQQDFHTEGKFDAQLYRSLLQRIGSSPALYKQELSEGLVLQQLSLGLESTGFVTESETADLVAIIHEQRSFYTVDIPADGIAESVSVSDEDIQGYYQDNQIEFLEPEKASIEYIELSVGGLSAGTSVNEEDIQAQYDQEVADFDTSAEYEIAHILIDSNSGDSELVEVQEKLAAGESFTELAKAYSDDAGSKDAGGSLGTLVAGIFPEDFENAVYKLEEGQVSSPVKTDAGIHLIKVVTKTVAEVPNFADRKSSIEASLKRARAEEVFVSNLELLDELTFSADNLQAAAAELGLEVQVSALFERTKGQGIAANAPVRNAAFEPEVLVDGHNSKVIELAGNRALVLRLKEHAPEHIKPLELISEQVKQTLLDISVEDVLKGKADAFIATVKGGSSVEALAAELNYGFTTHENASRTAPVSDPATRQRVFSAVVKEGSTTFETNKNADGSYRIVGITAKTPGTVESLDAMQVTGLATQLERENSRFEGSAYQADVIAGADIKIY
ncbi:SurA N-terminal domain-containing protein [Teredinibacter haidensis]|uniref:SurA N-terminal domain-containing protein n=1 Tax=Teredinibacter haidensis TaxID=2731755 RepID=UPI0009490D12|nr:SurA N-terminal domain-containing protein [Teredinibacter haidensis]